MCHSFSVFCLVLMMPADRCGHTIVLIYFLQMMYFLYIHVILLSSFVVDKYYRYLVAKPTGTGLNLLVESHLTY